MRKNKVLLVILDGWGLAPVWGGNAIGLANTPVMDKLSSEYPFAQLKASGEAVGLPYLEPGNSEVGHFNIGSGKALAQGLSSINQMVKNNTFFENKVLRKLLSDTATDKRALHLIGLLSDGGIHSHIKHLFALLEMAKRHGVEKVFIHVFTDGRDSPPMSGIKFIELLEDKIAEIGIGNIATIGGRYFGMDRDRHWDRVQKAYSVICDGEGKIVSSAKAALLESYANGITDEFFQPVIVRNPHEIQDMDSVIFFNFRSDRARQLTKILTQDIFDGFKRKKIPKNIRLATFASYYEDMKGEVIFGEEETRGQIASIFAENNITHLHAAETEKYAHVTYFFNGGIEVPFKGEERILVSSPKVPTYDLCPEMSAKEVTDKTIKRLGEFDFIVMNYANVDMVGHTGNMKMEIKAVETVDGYLGKIVQKALLKNYIIMITADHGNGEQMIDAETGLEDTEHTNNPVPYILLDKKYKISDEGRLCDIAPTVLDIMSLDASKEMQGKSLVN